MRTLNEPLLTNGDASGNLTSQPLSLEQAIGYCITATIAGTAAGTLSLQGSTDTGTVGYMNPALGVGISNWTTISQSQASVTGTGEVTWNAQSTFYRWVRVIYSAVSGTGSMTIVANTKGV